MENAGDAQRLLNGNTLISCGTQKRVIEVTPDKQIAWQFTAADAPELNITWVSSIQRLANGNLIVGNFLRGQEGKGAHAFASFRRRLAFRMLRGVTPRGSLPGLTTSKRSGCMLRKMSPPCV